DRVVAEGVGFLDSLREGHSGERCLPDLVAVVMDEPVGVDLIRETLLVLQDGEEREDAVEREGVQPDHTASDERLGDPPGPVRGLVVDDTDVNAVRDEVLETSREVELLVPHGQEGHDPHRHRGISDGPPTIPCSYCAADGGAVKKGGRLSSRRLESAGAEFRREGERVAY